MAIDDQIKNLTKQLFPTGRVWRVNPNSVKEKLINGLLASEIRAYNDAVSILNSSLPDNANFTTDDASAWEARLGLPDGTGVDLADRMSAIKVQLNWPGTNPAKGAADYIQSELQAAGYNVCVHENLFLGAATFNLTITTFNGQLQDVCYGNGKFVAAGIFGGNGAITYSTDGINWSSPSSISTGLGLSSITFGNGLFVATTTGKVYVSSDAISWTSYSLPNSNTMAEHSICYGNGLFVIVHYSGTGNRVTTSPDGVTWTSRTSAADYGWIGVTYDNGKFVAVNSSPGTSVMTSPDGIIWSLQSCPTGDWYDVTFALGLFVAVAFGGANRVMTSSDGITWTARTPSSVAQWYSISFGNSLFYAVSFDGLIMSSPDGITWTSVVSPAAYQWKTVTFGNSMFVSVSYNLGYPHNIMYSSGGGYFYKTYAQFAGNNLVRYISTLLYGQQRYGFRSNKGIIVANSIDPSIDDSFNIGDGSDTIFIGGCPPGTFINIPKTQETAFRQFILKIKPVNITVLLLVNFV